jgi:hypothetical protein
MLTSEYIEDVFIEFVEFAGTNRIAINRLDHTAATNFFNLISDGKQLTEAQANYILKILEKHKNLIFGVGFDYRHLLENPKWKNAFRVIDLTKKIFVETDSLGTPIVCLRFPYQLKKEFENEIDRFKSVWDHERKLRLLNLYDFNLIQLYEFAKKHNFEIDDTFMIAVGEVEEIWQTQDEILPVAEISLDWVTLKNASIETENWFAENATGVVEHDLLLAKSMGYRYVKNPEAVIHPLVEKISLSDKNLFWIKDNETFLNLCEHVTGKIAIVLDRAADSQEWVRTFSAAVENSNIPKDSVRVCFRLSKELDTNNFNQWVSDSGHGGKVEDGRIYIFNHRPAKWLFNDLKSVTMLVTNNLFPNSSQLVKQWLDSHSCVIYLGNVKPTPMREQKIVDL